MTPERFEEIRKLTANDVGLTDLQPVCMELIAEIDWLVRWHERHPEAETQVTALRAQLADADEALTLLGGYKISTADKILLAQATLATIKGDAP